MAAIKNKPSSAKHSQNLSKTIHCASVYFSQIRICAPNLKLFKSLTLKKFQLSLLHILCKLSISRSFHISLSALDFHVISDEEVIEDALFGGRFSSLSEHFLIDMVQMLSQSDDLETPQKPTPSMEKEVLHNLYRKTNSILAKHSPVLIMQKTVRGYFARKFRKYLIQNNILLADVVDGNVPPKIDVDTLNKEVKPRLRRQSIRSIPQKSRVCAREGPVAIEEEIGNRGQKVTFDENLPKDNLPEILKSLNMEGQPTRQATILPGAPVTTPKSANLVSFRNKIEN